MTLRNLKRPDLVNFFPIFDLDNTIISEFKFIYFIFHKTLIELKFRKSEATNLLISFKKQYEKSGSLKIIDMVLKDSIHYENFLDRYVSNLRSKSIFDLNLNCDPDIIEFANSQFFSPSTFNIITNGNPDQQFTKIINTNFHPIEKEIKVIYANLFSPKPDSSSFKSNFDDDHNYLYIGDSLVDYNFSKNSNIEFLHINELKNLFNQN